MVRSEEIPRGSLPYCLIAAGEIDREVTFRNSVRTSMASRLNTEWEYVEN